MSRKRERHNRAFTLAEMMLTLALVALVYTMISTILVQISRYVNDGRKVAESRHTLLKTVEELRYQFRSLYYPTNTVALEGRRTPLDGQDTVQFATSNGRVHKGIVEVSYRVQEYIDEKDPTKNAPALYYREFPFRRKEFRPLDEHVEAPWKVYLKDVGRFELEYTQDGRTWQKEWDAPYPPSTVRVRIKRVRTSHDDIVFDVTPGIGAGRW